MVQNLNAWKRNFVLFAWHQYERPTLLTDNEYDVILK